MATKKPKMQSPNLHDVKVNTLTGAAAEDFLGKLSALEIGHALRLPSPMPGLTGQKVEAKLIAKHEQDGRTQWEFELMWMETYFGTAFAEITIRNDVELWVNS